MRQLAGDRLRRVLALVPYVADHPGVDLDELATRFEVSRRDLERDLELLWYCGLPPYSPDRLIDVEIVDGRVTIRFAEYFARPVRLTPAEALALLAAGSALLAVPGSDPDGTLARALGKLAGVLGVERSPGVDVGKPAHLEELRAATDRGSQVEIEYYSFGRDATTTRVVDPHAVFHAFGHWYLDAYCHRAHDSRLFRLDRVRSVVATGEPVAHDPEPGDAPPVAVYQPRVDDVRVTLRLEPDAQWVLEAYPHESAQEQADGSWRVVLAVSERAWIERLLLRLGPAVTVLEPPEIAAVPADVARRILERYRS